jgi:hypothetical protein
MAGATIVDNGIARTIAPSMADRLPGLSQETTLPADNRQHGPSPIIACAALSESCELRGGTPTVVPRSCGVLGGNRHGRVRVPVPVIDAAGYDVGRAAPLGTRMALLNRRDGCDCAWPPLAVTSAHSAAHRVDPPAAGSTSQTSLASRLDRPDGGSSSDRSHAGDRIRRPSPW